MAHYFDVIINNNNNLLLIRRKYLYEYIQMRLTSYIKIISFGIKQMNAQFALLFELHNAMVLLSKLS